MTSCVPEGFVNPILVELFRVCGDGDSGSIQQLVGENGDCPPMAAGAFKPDGIPYYPVPLKLDSCDQVVCSCVKLKDALPKEVSIFKFRMPQGLLRRATMDVQYIRRSRAWIHAIVF
jgi:hypothetical protein